MLFWVQIWGDSGEAGGTHHRMALTLGFCITHSICVLGSVGFFQGLRTLKLCEKHRIMPDKEPDPKVVSQSESRGGVGVNPCENSPASVPDY